MVKVGDTVVIMNNKGSVKHWLELGTEGKVKAAGRDMATIQGVSRIDGLQIIQTLDNKQFKKTTKTTKMKKQSNFTAAERVNAVLNVAKEIAINNNNTITTLELKIQLENKFPNEEWNQYQNGSVLGVSNIFHSLVAQGYFVSVANNGTFQVYADRNLRMPSRQDIVNVPVYTEQKVTKTVYVNTNKPSSVSTPTVTTLVSSIKKANPAPKTKATKAPVTGTPISRTKALELLKGSKGHFLTVVFKKKDGTIRTLNGQYSASIQPTIGLGNITLRESSKAKLTPKDSLRQFNINDLISIKTKGVVHNIKK